MIDEDKIMAFIDGLLDDQDAAYVAAYLLANPEKAREVADLRKQNIAIKILGNEILEEPIPEKLIELINLAKVNVTSETD